MRKGKYQKGQFTVQNGMAFVMPDLDVLLPVDYDSDPGGHPWLITRVDKYYVEMVMLRTLTSKTENKYRIGKLRFDDVLDIKNACPPLDPRNERISSLSMDKFRILPKKELFGHRLQLLNRTTKERNYRTEGEQSLCMEENELKVIRKELLRYSELISETEFDQFGYLEAEDQYYRWLDGEPVPKGFSEDSFKSRFEWKHIKMADPLAMFPKLSQMEPHEKADRILCLKVKYRDNRLRLTDEDLKTLETETNIFQK